MSKPKLLDLFCKAGGASMGYHRAGFDVTGVDIEPQKRYPFKFIQADALEYLRECGQCYDVIAASPPCQSYAITSKMYNFVEGKHPALIEPLRELLAASGKPWIIENVVGSPLSGITLCGLMFGLKVFRHRLFESNVFLLAPPHEAHGQRVIGVDGYVCVAGHGDSGGRCRRDTLHSNPRRIPCDHRTKASWARAMGIDWMSKPELTQAIPPAYTEFIGSQLIKAL